MENLTKFKLNGKRWAVQLALTTGLALLFLAALLGGLQDVTPARADPGTLYVDGAIGSDDSDCSNPADPCATIGYALTQAGNGDEILVAAGTYTETLDVFGNPLALRGGYTISGTAWLPQGETVIDANGADSPVFTIGPGNNVTIEGFTIQGANHVSDQGGGFFINGAIVIISGTMVCKNETANIGGGIAVVNSSSAVIVDTHLFSNTAGHGGGGIMVDASAQAEITNVVIEHNSADYGGGIAVSGGASAYISGTRVISNTAESGGGVGIWNNGPVVVMANTIISDNYATDFGGLSMWEPGGTFTGTNLLVVDNRSGPGQAGCFSLWGISGGRLMNVTVSGNDSATGSGGAVVEGPVSGFPIVNSIFWGNGTDGANLWGTNLNVSYSDVQGGFTGTGNIDADPLFIGGGDYHLGVGSPCIDKGTQVGAPAADIEGTPRDAAPDMGAYEWTGFRIFLPLTLRNFGP